MIDAAHGYGRQPNAEPRDFSSALAALKRGARVFRAGWNGKGMWLSYAAGGAAFPPMRAADAAPVQVPAADNRIVALLPFIVMRTVQGQYVPWLASQTDLLAEDWIIKEGDDQPPTTPIPRGETA